MLNDNFNLRTNSEKVKSSGNNKPQQVLGQSKTNQAVPLLESNITKNSGEVKYNVRELGAIARFLQRKLKDYYLNLTREGEFLKFLAPKRGNQVYEELYLKPKIREIQKSFKGLVKVEKKQNGVGLTNSLFITLTLDSKYDREEAWGIVKEKTSQFIDKLKKALGDLAYVKVLEAHYSGKPHLHLIIVLETLFEFRIDAKGRGYILKQGVYDYFKNTIDKCWGYGFVDVQAIRGSGEALGYIAKYGFKASEIETTLGKIQNVVEALDRVEAGLETLEGVQGEIEASLEGLSEADVKKLYLHYYARQFKLRIFTTSRLRRLDSHYNNSDRVGGWLRVSEIDLPPELNSIAGKFTKLWLIRAGPGWIKAIGLIDKTPLISSLPEKGIIAHLQLVISFWDLTPDIPFWFLGQGEVAGLWLCGVLRKFKGNSKTKTEA